MKSFLKKLLLFALLPGLILVGLEIFVNQVPSAMRTSSRYFMEHKDSVELLILGSSHNQNAINPAFFKSAKTANLAFGGQDPRLDSLLLAEYLPEMPQLKYVVLELSYLTLEHANPANYPKNALYYKYFDVNPFTKWLDIKKISIFLSNPALYIKTLDLRMDHGEINQYGYQTELSDFEQVHNRFENMGYDTAKIDADRNSVFIQGHKKEDLVAYERNKIILDSLVHLCISHNITPIILLPPMYKTYNEEMIPAKKQRRDEYLAYLLQKYPQIVLWNFEKDHGYTVREFINEDHLNPRGAELFTKRLDSLLRSIGR